MKAGPFKPTAAALVILAGCCAAAADNGKRDMRGIGLGMSIDEIVAKAKVPCRINKAGNVSCIDPSDGSSFKVLPSGGKPSIALAIKHSFCSPTAPAGVIASLLKTYGLPASAAHANPNGTTLDLSGAVQGILVVDGDACPKGRRSYEFTLRDASLMQMQTGAGSAQSGTSGPPDKP